MAIDVNAELKRRRLSDGALVSWDVNDDGSTPVAIIASQVADLKNVSLPAAQVTDLKNVSLPAAQVTDLKTVTVANPTPATETGLAKEATLASILAQLDDVTADTVLSVLKSIFTRQADGTQKVAVTNPTAAPETGLAKEATLASVLAQLDDTTADTVLSVLKALLGKDFATQTTLEALRSAFVAEDFATQATLAEVANSLGARLDADTTLGVIGLLKALKGKDFATQTTLEALRSAFVAEDFATQTTLEALRAAFVAEDFSTNTTLVEVRDRLPVSGLASEATLDDLRDAFRAVMSSTNYLKTEVFYEVEALEGRMFGVGAHLITDVTTPNAAMTIINPVGSGKRLIVVSWSCYADATATILYYFGGTNVGTLRPPFSMAQHITPVPVSVMEVRAGAGVYTPGNALPMNSRVATTAPLRASGMYISLGPGQSFTQRFLGPGATNNVWMNFEYAEKPL